ncbi:MAG: hypothetical protein AAB874_08310 [Patescibacteria group bacterium]
MNTKNLRNSQSPRIGLNNALRTFLIAVFIGSPLIAGCKQKYDGPVVRSESDVPAMPGATYTYIDIQLYREMHKPNSPFKGEPTSPGSYIGGSPEIF